MNGIIVLGLSLRKIDMNATSLALCLDNEGYRASLEVGKIYPAIRDKAAEKEGYLRVIDESGEDYTLPPSAFISLSFLSR